MRTQMDQLTCGASSNPAIDADSDNVVLVVIAQLKSWIRNLKPTQRWNQKSRQQATIKGNKDRKRRHANNN